MFPQWNYAVQHIEFLLGILRLMLYLNDPRSHSENHVLLCKTGDSPGGDASRIPQIYLHLLSVKNGLFDP
jgi:hypothetical protein